MSLLEWYRSLSLGRDPIRTYRRVVVQEQCSSWLFLVFSIVDLFSWCVVDISRHVFNPERHRLTGVRYFKKKKRSVHFYSFCYVTGRKKTKTFSFLYFSRAFTVTYACAAARIHNTPTLVSFFLVVILFCFLRWWIQSNIRRIIQKKKTKWFKNRVIQLM